MTSSETRALRHAALLILGLGLLRTAAESVRSPMATAGSAVPDSSSLEGLLQDSRESRDEARRRALPLASGERIDVNTSGEEDLDRLPGVGPAVAARIIRMREERGSFSGPDDLLSVPGVGPATLSRIAPHLEWPDGQRLGRLAPPPPDGSTRFQAGRSTRSRPGRPIRPLQVDPNSGATTPIRIDLNRAGREDLETLPGVGPVMAGRILSFREKVGRIRALEELEAVRGIGSATIERLRPFVIPGG